MDGFVLMMWMVTQNDFIKTERNEVGSKDNDTGVWVRKVMRMLMLFQNSSLLLVVLLLPNGELSVQLAGLRKKMDQSHCKEQSA